ncbi:MAG: response regulator [Oscillospiraceae bacterium]|jgi:putative two-component system response regulator|nr:response regulator [Oscillospiraceae bacterium]
MDTIKDNAATTEARKTILAVDDDPIVLESVRVSLMSSEFSIVPLTSGKQVFNFFERKDADLILLDCYMPDMDGFEVFTQLRSNPKTKNIPVIFLTGAADGDSETAALNMGAADYITKPIRPSVLTARVKNQLELIDYRRNLENLVTEQSGKIIEANTMLKKREDVILTMLARITDMRDSETGDHIIRTTKYSKILAEDLYRSPKEGYPMPKALLEDIVKSAKLHDLGKIAIPDNVLLKNGRLTKEEFDIIKTHPAHGAMIMDVFSEESGDDHFLDVAHDIALRHHEKWNGTGYPDGLSGFNIPLSARIVAVADVYDALTSRRPYKEPFSHKKAVEIICDDSGIHFDPYLVTVFTRHAAEFETISLTQIKKSTAI